MNINNWIQITEKQSAADRLIFQKIWYYYHFFPNLKCTTYKFLA